MHNFSSCCIFVSLLFETLISSIMATSRTPHFHQQQKLLQLLFWSSVGLFLFTTASEDILTNSISVNSNQVVYFTVFHIKLLFLTFFFHYKHIITYLTRGATAPGSSLGSSICPKWLNCTAGYFDEGKDCNESGGHRVRCTCIAHCCLAFDCRHWGHLVQCRRKCGATPNRFGLRASERLDCDKYACERTFFDAAWDARGATEGQRTCIAHCCYAFDCRRSLGYCRHACGVENWVTARPLGR